MFNEAIFKFFAEISSIPRGSGNERAVSDYIADFARARNLWVHQDEQNSLIIKKPGSRGYEDKEPVIIQGHLDMVCEKNSETDHDFLTDPIKIIVDGDYIRADGTTLGGDNGVAVAYAMALLDGEYTHPPLTVVLTTNEEVGMDGAAFLDPKLLSGSRLINIDNDDEGVFITSCAGGLRMYVRLPVSFEKAPEDKECVKIIVKGLAGGHSGMEIDKGRANANITIARILVELTEKFDICVSEIQGGLKDNAIPREGQGTIYIKSAEKEEISAELKRLEEDLSLEYRTSESAIQLIMEDEKNKSQEVINEKDLPRVFALITSIPNGPLNYSGDIEDLVETSNNLGILRTDKDGVLCVCAIRSSVVTRKYWLQKQIEVLAKGLGGETESRGNYPAWEYSPKSELRDSAIALYEKMYENPPTVDAIHAGLECGIFAEKIPGVDMLAMGPNILDVHTPQERISISSARRVWEFLLELLKML